MYCAFVAIRSSPPDCVARTAKELWGHFSPKQSPPTSWLRKNGLYTSSAARKTCSSLKCHFKPMSLEDSLFNKAIRWERWGCRFLNVTINTPQIVNNVTLVGQLVSPIVKLAWGHGKLPVANKPEPATGGDALRHVQGPKTCTHENSKPKCVRWSLLNPNM